MLQSWIREVRSVIRPRGLLDPPTPLVEGGTTTTTVPKRRGRKPHPQQQQQFYPRCDSDNVTKERLLHLQSLLPPFPLDTTYTHPQLLLKSSISQRTGRTNSFNSSFEKQRFQSQLSTEDWNAHLSHLSLYLRHCHPTPLLVATSYLLHRSIHGNATSCHTRRGGANFRQTY
jgi:hypothetical protein